MAGDRIKAEVPNTRIKIVRIDLGDLHSVAQCADEFLSRSQQLDLLINDAGVVAPRQRMTTQDGFELQWGTNHLVLLRCTGRLLPAILSASQGRIVTVSSLTHRGAKIDFDDLNREKSFDRSIAYGQSKLANAVFGIELQKRLNEREEPAISLVSHPGISRTDLTSNIHGLNPTFQSWLDKTVMPLFGQPASQDALPILYYMRQPLPQP
jgi:NAD(P)-dependent dehydrogenase (short-subunit alcohol dehydrogenase family)